MFLSKRAAHHRGIMAIEAAIVLPLLIILTLALIEYGWLFLKAQHVTNASRQGARIGARADSTSTDIANAVDSAMTNGGMGGVFDLTIAPADVTVLESGQTLSVTVHVAYDNIGLFGLTLIPTPDALETTVVMAREGF